MNAYELADKLSVDVWDEATIVGSIHLGIKMLRQQADRIAELEKKCKWYDDTYRLPTDQQSAEPFIWLKQDFDGEWIEVHPNKGIPLYTTPQIKELSDEEIEQIAVKWYVGTRILPIGFARAILKKASEK